MQFTQDHKNKISLALKGRVRSLEHRRNLSLASMGRETKPAIERFMSHVEKAENGCWNWTGGIKPGGYGVFGITKNKIRKAHNAHRWAYINMVGDIPEGLTVDHLCRNRKCVNPSHMEIVTIRENLLRGTGYSARNARKTHCPKGHLLIAVPQTWNTSAQRHCPICEHDEAKSWNKNNRERKNENNSKYYHRNKERLRAINREKYHARRRVSEEVMESRISL